MKEDVYIENVLLDDAKELEKQPITDWPKQSIEWDLTIENWHLSMDDHDPESFKKEFPDAEIVWVKTSKLLRNLTKPNELPFPGFSRGKIARLVIHLQNGGKVSPPCILLGPEILLVAGGNHRIHWANIINLKKLPILIRAVEKSPILALGLQGLSFLACFSK
jgi:hypothetical protein